MLITTLIPITSHQPMIIQVGWSRNKKDKLEIPSSLLAVMIHFQLVHDSYHWFRSFNNCSHEVILAAYFLSFHESQATSNLSVEKQQLTTMSLKIFKNNQLAVFAHGCINLNHDYCIFLQIFVRIYCLLYGKSTYTETRVKFHLISISQKWDQLAFSETVIV